MRSILFLATASLLTITTVDETAQAQTPLADIYRGGTIRLVPEFEVTDSDLPDGMFFVGFEQAWSTSLDGDGNIYFADYGANHIKVFAPDGSFRRVLGREGAGPGEFLRPYLTTFSNDRLVVWDMGNTRFCVLTTDGEMLSSRPLDRGAEGWPQRLQALPDGRIVMQSRKNHPDEPREMVLEVLRLYTPQMQFIRTIHEQESRLDKWVPEENTAFPRPFPSRLYSAVLPDGRIAVGFSETYRIQIIDVDSGLVGSITHETDRVPVTAEDRRQWFGGMVVSRGGVIQEGAPPEIVRNTEFPHYMPAFDQVLADSEGNLLVHAFRKGQQEERFRYRYYDAFTAAGEYLGEVTIEGDGRFPFTGAPIRDRTFITGVSAETGEITFLRYRIAR